MRPAAGPSELTLLRCSGFHKGVEVMAALRVGDRLAELGVGEFAVPVTAPFTPIDARSGMARSGILALLSFAVVPRGG